MNPLLQTWQKTGLHYIFFSDENRVQDMRAASQETRIVQDRTVQENRAVQESKAVQENRAVQNRNSQGYNINQENESVLYQRQESSTNSNAPTQNYQNKESNKKHTLNQEQNRSDSSQASSLEMFMNREILSFNTWPNSWIAVKDRCNLPTDSIKARVAWTYEGLEEDLMGGANPDRQNIIRRLLRDLNHSGDRHYFWPYRLASVLEQTDHMEKIFWSGLALMRPRVLLIFGSEARDAVGLSKIFTPFVQQEITGVQILQMHKPETLIQDEKLYKETVVFLETYLGFCKKNL